MLTNEVEIIEGYFDFVCIRPSIRDAWNHIKKELEELSKTPTNTTKDKMPPKVQCSVCGVWFWNIDGCPNGCRGSVTSSIC